MIPLEKNPESIERLASEIAESWASKRSNYIIVAPPCSEPNRVFQLLINKEFQRRTLGKRVDNLAVAKIGQSDFRDHTRLTTAILQGWNLSSEIQIDAAYPLSALELALEEIERREGIPVILVDRFHDALKWLDGDFGITLRDLENDHFLKTVVAIPIKLEELKRRAKAEPKGSLFLQSDWGQGHREKILKGYSELELIALLREKSFEENISKELAKMMYQATAGLPNIVDRLVGEISNSMTAKSFEHFLCAESPRLCKGLLDWLDGYGADVYQRLAAESLNCANMQIRGTSLADHSWSELLFKKDGSFTCFMLAWASIDQLASKKNRAFVEMISEHARSRQFAHLEKLLPRTRKGNDSDSEIWKALEIVNRFCSSTDIYQREWAESSKYLAEISQLANRSRNVHFRQIAEKISLWRPLTDMMCAYSAQQKSEKNLRLEDFVCRQKSLDDFSAFLQLHQLRLNLAARLDPLPAMKLVIELPESLLQVYGCYKFDLKFWNFQGLEEESRKMVENRFRRPFNAPQKGQRLQFQELLWLSYVKASQINSSEDFFGSPDDLLALEDQYKARCQQVHSASFASASDWISYKRSCNEFIEIVAKAVLFGKTVDQLPDPAECFCELANTLKDVALSH